MRRSPAAMVLIACCFAGVVLAAPPQRLKVVARATSSSGSTTTTSSSPNVTTGIGLLKPSAAVRRSCAVRTGATMPADRVYDGHDILPLLRTEPEAKSPTPRLYYYSRSGKLSTNLSLFLMCSSPVRGQIR